MPDYFYWQISFISGIMERHLILLKIGLERDLILLRIGLEGGLY
jgi:hypothetical protein